MNYIFYLKGLNLKNIRIFIVLLFFCFIFVKNDVFASEFEYSKCINGANIKRYYIDNYNNLEISFKKGFLNNKFCYYINTIKDEKIISDKKNYSNLYEIKFTDINGNNIVLNNTYSLKIKGNLKKYNTYGLYLINYFDDKASEIKNLKVNENYYQADLRNNYLNIGILGSERSVTFSKEGYATYYGTNDGFHGKKTASGEIFDRNKFTAAMNDIKLGSYARVTNLSNNKEVIVKINDRMGSVKNIIDLSVVGFKEIANLSTGRIKVKVEILE